MKNIPILGGGTVEVHDALYDDLIGYDWIMDNGSTIDETGEPGPPSGEPIKVVTYGTDLMNEGWRLEEGWTEKRIAHGFYNIEEMIKYYNGLNHKKPLALDDPRNKFTINPR